MRHEEGFFEDAEDAPRQDSSTRITKHVGSIITFSVRKAIGLGYVKLGPFIKVVVTQVDLLFEFALTPETKIY